MEEKERIYNSLVDIVGEDFLSNRQGELYIYSRDPGASKPRRVDYVVMPKTVEEVQRIVKLANEEKIPITPMGGGLTLSGLVVPIHGGIVLDMKRMDKIIEVNEKSRYALIEAGVSEGALKYYLEKNHPSLRHSMPDSPPMATVVGNTLTYGQGHLSKHGAHSEMINGLEVILPTGEICKIGSSSVSPYWFGRGPIPDLAGLFINWFGTTGVVTKLSVKLYPKPKKRDMLVFIMENPDLLPDAISKITQTEMMEDLLLMGGQLPGMPGAFTLLTIFITGNSEEEFEFKNKLFKKMFQEYEGIEFMEKELLPPKIVRNCLEEPQYAAGGADFKKGGGFEYVGAYMPLEKVPVAYKKGIEVAHKHELDPAYAIRSIGCAHTVMFAFAYPFNRADEEDILRVNEALLDTNKMILELGGIPWKAELGGQKLIMEKMDPNTFELIKRIKKLLDPNGIMNPGNWEAD